MAFGESYLLLQQEGFLVRTSLAQGLTLLRSANLDEKGHYYGAFFGLSVGIERLLKVIIVLDHMARNAMAAPSVRKYGHDLLKLLGVARNIPVASGPHPLAPLEPSALEYEILNHLNDFAEACGRYANFEALAATQPVVDPLTKWKGITQRLLDEDVPEAKREAVHRQAAALARALSDAGSVTAHDLDKTPLTLQDWFEVPRMQELAARRAVVHVFRILCPLKQLLGDVNDRAIREGQRLSPQGPAVPCMDEFLDFVWPDERLTQRKKKWP